PREMLEMGMDLEGDLGVDSIKRVEILAAMREQASELPEVDPAELGKLRTLQEIVDRMGAELGDAPATPAAAPSASAPSAAGLSLGALSELMLVVVAEKTGYPREMLEMGMDLEGDLGVDSIKRVEILAAMREQAPSLPEVDPAELGKLRTLQEIVDRMGAELGGGGAEGTPAGPR
ncbi:MAG: phosphopantetheine-binding protein, partial [Myxococcota bacterium]